MIKLNIKYINIPSNLLFDSNVQALAKIIYGQIKVLSYKTGVCEMTNKIFAENNHCSTKTVSRMLKILKENNYIKIVGNKIDRKIIIL